MSCVGSEVNCVIVFEVGSKSKSCVGPLELGVSAAKITWPLGSSAPGALSGALPFGIVGPATHELVDGVYKAVLPSGAKLEDTAVWQEKGGPELFAKR